MDQSAVPLAAEPGASRFPAFSPDGKRLAYSGRVEGRDHSFHIFVRSPGSGSARQLTDGAANDYAPVWSPDGSNIAFVRVDGGSLAYLTIPVGGGPTLALASFVRAPDAAEPEPSLSSTPDGKSLAAVIKRQPWNIALISAAGVGRRLTEPGDAEADSQPAISPDGKTLAFARTSPEGQDIFLSSLSDGSLRRLTWDDRAIRGIAWTPEGRDLIYSSDRGRGWQLWRVPADGGSPRQIVVAAREAQFPAVPRGDAHLAYEENPSVAAIWRAPLGKEGSTEENASLLIRSNGSETAPAYSPDGGRIADVSDQSGADEIWVSDAAGANRVRITNFRGPRLGQPRWSPDGGLLVFEVFEIAPGRGVGPVIYKAAVNGGKTARLLPGNNPTWSHNGRSIYFQWRGKIWKTGADGTSARPLTQSGANSPAESADSKYVYYRNRHALWRMPAEGGEEERIADLYDSPGGSMRLGPNGIYYADFDRSSRSIVIMLNDLSSQKDTEVFRINNLDFGRGVSFSFDVSPDGKHILFSKVDRNQTNLMLVEGFR